MNTQFRSFTVEDAVASAAAALSRAWNERITLEDVTRLSEDRRRNHVIRAIARRPSGNDRHIVIKATRAAGYDASSENAFAAMGLAREWSAATLLGALAPNASYLAPLLASDATAGVMVYADIGAEMPSMVPTLLKGSWSDAEACLLEYATSLGQLHAATKVSRDRHMAAVRTGYPNARVANEIGNAWLARPIASSLLGGELPEADVTMLRDGLREPGPWLVLLHQDLCPDNVLVTAQGLVFLDFEFAAPGHAMLDATYWHVGFPTCWCAGRVPNAVAEKADAAYRNAVAQAIPEALDTAGFMRERALAMVAHMFVSLAWHLERALEHEEQSWGIATNRGRILWRIEAAIAASEQADILAGIRFIAADWLRILRDRWPDTTPLPLYPAFVE